MFSENKATGLIHPIATKVVTGDLVSASKVRSHSHLATGIRDIGPPSLVAVGGRDWLCAQRWAENKIQMNSGQADDESQAMQITRTVGRKVAALVKAAMSEAANQLKTRALSARGIALPNVFRFRWQARCLK